MPSDLEAIRSELARIRALEEKATKGPWRGDRIDGTVKYYAIGADGHPVFPQFRCWEDRSECSDPMRHEQDQDFTVSARTDVPRLVKIAELAVEMLRDGHTNFDCDTGANGTHPDYCRPCCAERALADIARLLKEE